MPHNEFAGRTRGRKARSQVQLLQQSLDISSSRIVVLSFYGCGKPIGIRFSRRQIVLPANSRGAGFGHYWLKNRQQLTYDVPGTFNCR